MTTEAGALLVWHDAPEREVREAAVILCRPFGYEAQCTHRSYRHLAQRLRESGFHVLRVDTHGTGDSSGGDQDGARVAAWVASVRAAIDWVRANLDVPRVALFGTRFGALLALEAAAAGDVDAVALFAPPASGRAWLREARALQGMMASPGVAKRSDAPPKDEESGGFLLTASTAAAMRKLDPGGVARVPRGVLIIARDDLPGSEEKIAEKLRARGADVTLSAAPGYGALMRPDPQYSVVPDAAWTAVNDWFVARYAFVEGASVTRAIYPTAAEVREHQIASAVSEEIVDIGGLFGVVTEPASAASIVRPTIVLHNMGVNSHIGANRMYVRMARRWAGLGFRVLRFDSSGLGDSPASVRVPENQAYSHEAIDDSRRVIDFLARTRGARQFVLLGLCSGAYVSYHAALADERVVGLVLLNILLFHWKPGDPVDARKRDVVKSTHFYWKAAFARHVWVRLTRGEVNVGTIAGGVFQKGWERARHRVVHAVAGESDVARGFRGLLRRGTGVLLAFSAEDGGRDVIDLHLGTNAERFRREPAFRFVVLEGADHTFSSRAVEEELLSLLTRHLTLHFPLEPPGPNDRRAHGGRPSGIDDLEPRSDRAG
jgi:alpha-beta hydrolase superfamily lysophospholipase